MTRRRMLLASLLVVAAAGGWGAWRRLNPPREPPPTQAQLDELRARRDALQLRLREALLKNGEKSLGQAPVGGVMIGLPTSFTGGVVGAVVGGLFGETTLTLKNLKVHKQGEVRAKLVLRKRTLGIYTLDVQIHQVRGILKPGKPGLSFTPGRAHLTLPVRLAEGTGAATLKFKWDSKGLSANMVCGDTEVTRDVDGNVVPEDYVVTGSFGIAAVGEAVRLTPSFPDLAVRIYVDPSDASWSIVDDVVRAQRAGCELALNKVDVKSKLEGILGKGFNVKIPQKIFKPIRLPAGVSQSLDLQGLTLRLDVKPTGVLVASDRIWYGADLTLATQKKPAAAVPVGPSSDGQAVPQATPSPQ